MNIETFDKAEAQLHVATQMISLTGINLVKKKDDDSHTTAKWDSEKQQIIGREFQLNGNSHAVFVDPGDFVLGILKNGEETGRVELDGLTYMQTVEPWKKWLTDAGFKEELNLKLHYDLPSSDLYKFDAFTKPSDETLSLWADNRTMANSVLEKLNNSIGVPSDINIWPHHFDSGTYYELHQTDGATDRSIGAGFNPADGMVDEPYFYIYGWYKDLEIDYTDKPKLDQGRWILGNWNGAVLPLSKVNESSVDQFYQITSHYLKNKLK